MEAATCLSFTNNAFSLGYSCVLNISPEFIVDSFMKRNASLTRHPKMSKEPLSYYRFRHYVPEGGYTWVKGWKTPDRSGRANNSEELLMVPAAELGTEAYTSVSRFSLKDEPGLFLKFARLENDPEAFVSFANNHGWLMPAIAAVNPQTNHVISVLPISVWRKELTAMKIATHLWDAVQRKDQRELRRFVKWNKTEYTVRLEIAVSPQGVSSVDAGTRIEDVLRRPYTVSNSWLVRGESEKKEMQRFGPGAGWEPGDTIGPARLEIQKLINERLEKYCHPRLYLGKDGKHVGMITAVNLLGCLWLQFYQEVSGLQRLRRCEICHEELDVLENRSHKRVHDKCSRRERMRRYRAAKGNK